MTVETKPEERTPMDAGAAEQNVVTVVSGVEEDHHPKLKEEEEEKAEEEKKDGEEEVVAVVQNEKSASFREESNFLSDLKEQERKALFELRDKLEEAILDNKLFLFLEEGKAKVEEEEVQVEKKEAAAEVKEKPEDEASKDADGEKADEDEKMLPKEEEEEKGGGEKKQKKAESVVIDNNNNNKDVSIWGVPLLPSKGLEETDVILLKFLRAREFKVEAALEMLKSTLRWRKESNIDSILDEDEEEKEKKEAEEESNNNNIAAAYMDSGVDLEGHPICYNLYGVFGDEQVYQKTFGTEEKTEQFLRWRFQLMEKGIRRLDFKPGGATMILQIIDLKNAPGLLSKKELRVATKRAVALLQDNYPEFVARNVFINVPFWYYAFNALLSPFLTQRTKSKLVFSRPAKLTETLLGYIPAEEIPLHYGGLRRENDTEFDAKDGGVSEVTVKAGSTENIELPAPLVGTTLLWDLTVLGWEVNYKEEFVPDDQGSYTVIVHKGRKMGSQEQPLRNSFRNNEPGKVVLTVENNTYKKKKLLYRYKAKTP